PEPGELRPLGVHPLALGIGEERPLDQLERLACRVEGLGRRPLRRGDLGGARTSIGDLDVDPRLGPELALQARAAPGQGSAERPAKSRQQRAERCIRILGPTVRPEDVDQLVPRHRTPAVADEVREEEYPAPGRKRTRDVPTLDLSGERAAEHDPRGGGGRHLSPLFRRVARGSIPATTTRQIGVTWAKGPSSTLREATRLVREAEDE